MRRERILLVGLLAVALMHPSTARTGENEADVGAMKSELDQLRRERNTLESRVLLLQSQLDEVRTAATVSKSQAEALEKKCRVLQYELKLVKSEKPETPVIKPTEPPVRSIVNLPRQETARGRIAAIGSDGILMQISIGSDSGVKEGQTLDVFRLGSAIGKERIIPLYLGTLKLIRVDPQGALGHYRSVPGMDRRPKIGDEVASELFVK